MHELMVISPPAFPSCIRSTFQRNSRSQIGEIIFMSDRWIVGAQLDQQCFGELLLGAAPGVLRAQFEQACDTAFRQGTFLNPSSSHFSFFEVVALCFSILNLSFLLLRSACRLGNKQLRQQQQKQQSSASPQIAMSESMTSRNREGKKNFNMWNTPLLLDEAE
jgi:hypothetical protein